MDSLVTMLRSEWTKKSLSYQYTIGSKLSFHRASS